MVEAPFLRKLATRFAVILRPVVSHNSLSVTTRHARRRFALWDSLQSGWYIVPWESSTQWETLSSSPRLLSGHAHQSRTDQIQRPAMSVLVFRVVWVSPLGLRTLILLPCRTLVNHFVDVCIHAGPEDSTSRAQFTLQLPGVQHGFVAVYLAACFEVWQFVQPSAACQSWIVQMSSLCQGRSAHVDCLVTAT